MANFYSQNGEDIVLFELFRGRPTGFFVEVGCIDGRRFSNTLAFEEIGWHGICVEAHTGFIEMLKANRPGSIVCHCAVGPEDREAVSFFANARGSLSTLDASKEEQFRTQYGDYFSGFEEQKVPERRLDAILAEHRAQEIDLLSLDIEGFEVEAMKGLSLDRFRPKVLLIESDNPDHEAALDRMILPHGYVKSAKLGCNIFYLGDPAMRERIENRTFSGEVIHTEHPVDRTGDRRVALHFRLGRKPGFWARLFGRK